MDWSDLYFSPGIDVIEEDALNEKSCIQVLEILIPKADTEIEELEGDLFVLETQLEWAQQNKYEEWFDLCCKGLREKIHSLQLSICSLKSQNEHDEPDRGVQLQTHEEPPKKIHEIIKALLKNDCQDIDDQTADNIVKDFGSDASTNASRQSNDKQHLINIDSSAIKVEEVKEKNVTTKDKSIRSNSPLKTESVSPNQPETVKVQVAGVTATTHILLSQGQTEEDVTQLEQWEVQEPMIATTEKTLNLNSSSELQRSRSSQIEKHIINSEKGTIREPSFPVMHSTIGSNSSVNSKRRVAKMPKDKIRSDPMGVQNPDNSISSSSFSNSKGRGKRRADKEEILKSPFNFTNNCNSLSAPSNRNRTKKIVRPLFDRVQPSCIPTYSRISLDSVFKLQEKRMDSTIRLDAVEVKEPIVASDELLKLQGDTTESTIDDDLQLSKSCDVDKSDKFNFLNELKLVELKALAKSSRLKGYTKMSKAKLIEILTEEGG